MNICVVGAGYVGLTSGTVLADLGHTVCCIDTSKEKIDSLQKGEVPIYEPGLKELILKNTKRLTFSTSIIEKMKQAPVIFIAVGTPSLPSGKTDLTYISSVVDMIAESLTSYKTIITKSTVPPGTNDWIYKKLIEKGCDPQLFDVVSNPEFLREGTAIQDMVKADKIVVGIRKDDPVSLPIMKRIYEKINAPFIVTSLAGAEMIKYTSNAFLATKISFINEISRICDKYEVNVEDVAKGIGLDPRISPHFLQAGIGYGGSCFPKDVSSLEHSALSKNVTPFILQAVQKVNNSQVDIYMEKLTTIFPNMKDLKMAVLGIAFKANTDDTRYSPAVRLMEKMLSTGCIIHTYDPQAQLPLNHPNIIQHSSMIQAVTDADCVIIATDWKEIVKLDWKKVKELMKGEYVMDTRNCINPEQVRDTGLKYIGVART